MFQKLAGMTGTADTEAPEFNKIYNLEVMVIPTNKAMIRKDDTDLIYKNERAKMKAVVEQIQKLHEVGQPVLVGTISIEKSEVIAGMLQRRGIKHHVLNAKQHEREAEIVAQAGRFGAVTISTNMAGRGTDIVLGGNPEFMAKAKLGKEYSEADYDKALVEARKVTEEERKKVLEQGGLFILGTERHESRRIDNQLRGRSGRQGDPGHSHFFISLDDDLLRIFGSERISRMMERLKMDEDEAIFHPWISKAIENAQKKVEDHNFSIRKNLIEFDDVMNQQRRTIYTLRREILEGKNLKDKILDLVDEMADGISQEHGPTGQEDFNVSPLLERVFQIFDIRLDPKELAGKDVNADLLGEWIYNQAVDSYEKREKDFGEELARHIERVLMLQTIDTLWKDHLLNMDHLREGVGLRGYAQQDPIVAYKSEGFGLFQEMMRSFAEDVLQKLFRVEVQREKVVPLPTVRPQLQVQESHAAASAFGGGMLAARAAAQGGSVASMGGPAPAASPPQATAPIQRQMPKVGRNDPCPCGSGKKYKKCHGA
jgi:preprotein translocase subunit SecA